MKFMSKKDANHLWEEVDLTIVETVQKAFDLGYEACLEELLIEKQHEEALALNLERNRNK